MSVAHHVNRLVGVEVGLAIQRSQSKKTLLGILIAALPHKPPRRFGGKQNTDKEGNGPNPLQSPGKTETPFSGTVDLGANDTDADDLSKTPTEVDVAGEVSSERNGTDFRRISNCESLEDTPRNTAENLANEHGGEVLGSLRSQLLIHTKSQADSQQRWR